MRIAIYGYGNLGRGVEAAMRQNPDVDLIGVFSRRDPATVKTRTGTPVYAAADILNFKDKIDVLILCGGSATDLPELTPALAKDFCVVDSFDTHANIPTHYARVDEAAKADRVVVIHRGVLRADGKPKDVFSGIEYMHELGLAAPETVELCHELNGLGFDLPLDLLDTEDCARAIYKALGGN